MGVIYAAKAPGDEPVTAAEVLAWAGCEVVGPRIGGTEWCIEHAHLLGVTLHGEPQTFVTDGWTMQLATGVRLPVTARQVFRFMTAHSDERVNALANELSADPEPSFDAFDEPVTDCHESPCVEAVVVEEVPVEVLMEPEPVAEVLTDPFPPEEPVSSRFQQAMAQMQAEASLIPAEYKREFFPSVELDPVTRKPV